MLSMQVRVTGTKSLLKYTDHKNYVTATYRALNDAADRAFTEGARGVTKEFNLPQRVIKSKVKRRRASRLRLESGLFGIVDHYGIGLTNFGATWRRGRSVTRRVKGSLSRSSNKRAASASMQGVTVRIKQGKVTRLPHAFISRGKRGAGGLADSNAQVWVRGKNGALIPKKIPRGSTLFFREENAKGSIDKGLRSYKARFNHHYDRAVKKR